MNTLRKLSLIALAMAGQSFSGAVIAECYYGSDRYSNGTVLCQAGLRMQCQASEEGEPSWVSMEQQCDIPANGIDGETKHNNPVDAGSRGYKTGEDASVAASKQPANPDKAIGDDDESVAVAPSHETLPGASPGAGRGLVIKVLWATYGRDGHTCDASPFVMQRCNGEASCELAINAEAFCKNSYSGRANLLSVYWTCTNGEQSLVKSPMYGQDRTELTLQCREESAR